MFIKQLLSGRHGYWYPDHSRDQNRQNSKPAWAFLSSGEGEWDNYQMNEIQKQCSTDGNMCYRKIVKQVRFRERKVQEEIPNFKYGGQTRRPCKGGNWEKIWGSREGYILETNLENKKLSAEEMLDSTLRRLSYRKSNISFTDHPPFPRYHLF